MTISGTNTFIENPHTWESHFKRITQFLIPSRLDLSQVVKYGSLVAISYGAQLLISNSLWSDCSDDVTTACGISALKIGTGLLLAAVSAYFIHKEYSTPLDSMPEELFELLQKMNEEKPEDAPVALYLQAQADYNGAFSQPLAQADLIEIAKIHRLAMRVVRNKEEIQKAIDEVSVMSPIESLIIGAHGNSDEMQLDGFEYYTKDDDHQKTFAKVKGNKIYLNSCETAKGSESVANKIAETTKKIVWAPYEGTHSAESLFYACPKHLMEFISLNKNNKLTNHRLMPDGTTEDPCTDHQENIDLAALCRVKYLIKRSNLEDFSAYKELRAHFPFHCYMVDRIAREKMAG